MTGYLRGQNLSVNSLVHIPGWGDFQMLQIDAERDPYIHNQKTRVISGQVILVQVKQLLHIFESYMQILHNKYRLNCCIQLYIFLK